MYLETHYLFKSSLDVLYDFDNLLLLLSTFVVEVIVLDVNLIIFLLIFCLQGGLRNSKHECTLSSQEYVHELRSGITEEKLLNCLESLRVSLTSNPVRSVTQALFTHSKLCFVAGNYLNICKYCSSMLYEESCC